MSDGVLSVHEPSLEQMRAFLERAAARVAEDRRTTRDSAGGFSLVEHVWHLADLERDGYGLRIARLRDEAEPALPDFDGERVARERNYQSLSLSEGLTAFAEARERNLAALRAVSDWSRAGTQDQVGRITLADVPRMMVEHDASHRREIDQLLDELRPATATVAHYARLLDFDHWANRETLRSLRAGDTPPGRTLPILAHMIGAEWLWLARLGAESLELAVWPELTLAQCAEHLEALRSAWRVLLEGLDEAGLARVIRYTNSKGEAWASRVDDVLEHVPVHSAHHRGQIASALRAAGWQPAYTDYIQGARDHRF